MISVNQWSKLLTLYLLCKIRFCYAACSQQDKSWILLAKLCSFEISGDCSTNAGVRATSSPSEKTRIVLQVTHGTEGPRCLPPPVAFHPSTQGLSDSVLPLCLPVLSPSPSRHLTSSAQSSSAFVFMKLISLLLFNLLRRNFLLKPHLFFVVVVY